LSFPSLPQMDSGEDTTRTPAFDFEKLLIYRSVPVRCPGINNTDKKKEYIPLYQKPDLVGLSTMRGTCIVFPACTVTVFTVVL